MKTLPTNGSAEKKIQASSICFMGLAHLLFLRDYIKGIFFALCEIVFLVFSPAIVNKLIDLVTLGSPKPDLPIKQRDNSIFMLIDGILILALIAIFVIVYVLSVKSAKKELDEKKIELSIEAKGPIKNKIERSKEIFHLEDIYNMHKLDLSDFLNRYKKYSDPKRKEIIKLFHDSANVNIPIDDNQLEIFLDVMSSKLEKELLGMIECDESKQYPLKKMKEDLKKQLDSSKTT